MARRRVESTHRRASRLLLREDRSILLMPNSRGLPSRRASDTLLGRLRQGSVVDLYRLFVEPTVTDFGDALDMHLMHPRGLASFRIP